MKVLGERTETYHAIELSTNQLITLVIALGLSSSSERKRDAISFFEIENFQDDETLFDSLAELVNLSEKYYEKTPEKSISHWKDAIS